MTPDGTLYSLTPGGSPFLELVLFTFSFQQMFFTGGATFGG
jgi:hypothetical protein